MVESSRWWYTKEKRKEKEKEKDTDKERSKRSKRRRGSVVERSGEEASSGACCAGVHRSPGAWGSGGGSAPSRNRREAPRFPAPSSSRNGG